MATRSLPRKATPWPSTVVPFDTLYSSIAKADGAAVKVPANTAAAMSVLIVFIFNSPIGFSPSIASGVISVSRPANRRGTLKNLARSLRPGSKAKIRQARVVIWPPSLRPEEFSFRQVNGEIIDARNAALHQSVRCELPVFVSV